MLCGSDGKIDSSAAAYMCNVVLKWLLTKTQPNMTCAVTGSNLVLVWLSIAKMPPHGVSALTSCVPIHLPCTFPPDHMEEIWQECVQHFGKRPEELSKIYPRRPGCLVTMLEDFYGQEDLVVFANQWVYDKLVAEVRPVRRLPVLSACSVTRHASLPIQAVCQIAHRTIGQRNTCICKCRTYNTMQKALLNFNFMSSNRTLPGHAGSCRGHLACSNTGRPSTQASSRMMPWRWVGKCMGCIYSRLCTAQGRTFGKGWHRACILACC